LKYKYLVSADVEKWNTDIITIDLQKIKADNESKHEAIHTLEKQARPHNSRYTIHTLVELPLHNTFTFSRKTGFRILVHRVAATRRSEMLA
jgi:hypothetical protein